MLIVSSPLSNDGLFPAAYEDLRRMARLYLRSGNPHTLQPTALVHEAFLKLIDVPADRWESSHHFTHAAARAMRQILLDYTRRKLALKRTAGTPSPNEDPVGPDLEAQMLRLLHVDSAMEKLDRRNPELARIVELRYFMGCTSEETAELLNLPERIVRYRWGIAKLFLAEQLETAPS